MRLKNKIILVIGANGLLGKAIANQVEAEDAVCIGADVQFINDLEKGQLKMDITDALSIKEGLKLVYKRFDRIDGVVNAAYPRTVDWGKSFENIEIESWKRNVDMQLNSSFFLSQSVLEKMKVQGEGSLVHLSSIYGIVGPDFSIYEGTALTMPAAYSAIKGGLINFTRYLASYYGQYNIRINTVSPGGIFDQQPEEFVKKYEQKTPMRRMGTPEDIVGPVCFLLSDESRYITGHNLVVDGGWTSI